MTALPPTPILPTTVTDTLTAAGLPVEHVLEVASRTLAEDLAWGPDVTTEATLTSPTSAERARNERVEATSTTTPTGTADVVARRAGTLAGVPVAAAVAYTLAAQQGVAIEVDLVAADGDRVGPGDVALTVSGPLHCLLTAERSLLNLLGQLSGVATATAAWSDALAGSPTRVRDTRKTVPGLRLLQKYAVRCGGGVNHRMGLGDAALIKDNHVAAAGSVAAAYAAVRRYDPHIPVEVECDTLAQVREAIDAGADLVLLDNMSFDQLTEAVALCRPAGVRTEASGGLELADAAAVGATGVDYVAVGALTHSAPVLDLGLDLRSSSS
ncbi:nicotinate-nucleotide diphosphorylase (carboxylating) [Enemella evansiae]|uniref:carboxylating nicotinate-nucleotide diphosphorylase n=1 Tax=Enemella evansiae TaxID=2016499 RepID=UPI000B97C6D6|nr:carboxylating nicotinate-nucleotide diphosphorylase [Enemella evansiae]OYO14959.1 nicotinate-nucleotide diphosphorylase (carboxylating) [Enemella evansiae]OYO18752.1 nicotinate-nucleotide diphosphorylase (carboxylating) [Enemella evansiae]